ncbi:hypothetical protein Bca52824_014660 [Brassica carinata]|uniref:Uncharacterized protein n=1 Tax=Brassica carinata TaxID=52824 RepID=A0A8X8B504_BRACI|nr:hypothetical protein Bca52824_014660 [Brassica carinata]
MLFSNSTSTLATRLNRELSLDLANMTPEIRQTSEVLFARGVARVSQFQIVKVDRDGGNFPSICYLVILFVIHHREIARCLTFFFGDGIQEEDIEALLEYHGFSIKVFEEPYMKQTSVRLVDKEMTDSKTTLLLEEDKPVKTSIINPVLPSDVKPEVDQQKRNHFTPAGEFHSPLNFYSPGFPQAKSSNLKKQPNGGHTKSPRSVENIFALEEAVPEAAMTVTLEEGFHDIEQEDEDGHEDITNQLWKRWSSRQSECGASTVSCSCCNSLTLGTPIRLSRTDQSRACGEFDIDQAMKRRFEEREKSWSRLNISDVVADILVGRNPDFEMHMVEVNTASQDTHSAVSRWLSSKLIPHKEHSISDDNLVFSAPGVSVWNKRVASGSSNGESVDPDTNLVSELGLHDIDKSKIASFTIVSIANKSQKGQELQFFSDSRLRDGLKWLAGNSPLQPNLHHVKPRELALTHFSFSLELLKQMADQEVGPNICISAFNGAWKHRKHHFCCRSKSNRLAWP